jgi:transcriptional regulator with PAS, ATPase and Fis domain
VIPIYLPPLRQRKEDLPILVSSFIQRLQRITGKGISGLTPNAMKLFMEYSWPGNVRELKSALEYAFVIAESGLVDAEHLPPQFAQGGAEAADRIPPAGGSTEKTELIEALRRTNGNQTQAARLLGVNRVTVWNRMRKYGVDLKKVLP